MGSKKLVSCDIWLWDAKTFGKDNVQYIADADAMSAKSWLSEWLNVDYKVADDKVYFDLMKFGRRVPAESIFVIRFNYNRPNAPLVFHFKIDLEQRLKYEINSSMQLVTDTDFPDKLKPTKTSIGVGSNFCIFITLSKQPLDIDQRTGTEMLIYQVKNALVIFNQVKS